MANSKKEMIEEINARTSEPVEVPEPTDENLDNAIDND
jgi:hypothetical protein